MAIPEKFISELKERSDIVEVISEYVHLGKRSGANLFGLCPFHSERTPSFSVSPDRQYYHCFGCGKGGGVINFVMDAENLSFQEAVAFLARRAGMQMPEESDDADSRRRARMYALNKAAAQFFYKQLTEPAGAPARDYMARRGIEPATAKRFGLGAAPDSWSSLIKAMEALGYPAHELMAAGLAKQGKNGGFYDLFRGRLMFPVIDVQGRVIGFSGRILGDGEPKYLNSPETLVFSKSRNLFAMNLAKKSKSGQILLAEGNIDVVSLHQAGFDSAVASLGTSLTPEQARLISRYSNQVVIAYDSDGAGLKATRRAIEIFEKLDVKVKVLRMSGAKDPDEYIKLKGAEAFAKLLGDSENQIDYRLRSVKDKFDLSVDEQKVDYLKEATELVAHLHGQVERQVYAMRIAADTDVKGEVVAAEIERRRKQLLNRARSSDEKQLLRAVKSGGTSGKRVRYDDPASAAAEEGVVRLLYLEPELGRRDGLPGQEEFSSPELGRIYGAITGCIAAGRSMSVDNLAQELSPEDMGLLVALLQEPEKLSDSGRILSDYVNRIRQRRELGDKSKDLRALAEKLKQTKGYE